MKPEQHDSIGDALARIDREIESIRSDIAPLAPELFRGGDREARLAARRARKRRMSTGALTPLRRNVVL